MSKNQSIKHNLEQIVIEMVDIYEKDLLFYLLKAKSYGFAKLKIHIVNNHSIDPINIYAFDLSTLKIANNDVKFINLCIMINFLKSKSMQQCWRLFKMLDYYDFEDESGRKLIEDFILDMHHAYDNNLDQFFCRYIKHFDQPTKDYIEIT